MTTAPDMPTPADPFTGHRRPRRPAGAHSTDPAPWTPDMCAAHVTAHAWVGADSCRGPGHVAAALAAGRTSARLSHLSQMPQHGSLLVDMHGIGVRLDAQEQAWLLLAGDVAGQQPRAHTLNKSWPAAAHARLREVVAHLIAMRHAGWLLVSVTVTDPTRHHMLSILHPVTGESLTTLRAQPDTAFISDILSADIHPPQDMSRSWWQTAAAFVTDTTWVRAFAEQAGEDPDSIEATYRRCLAGAPTQSPLETLENARAEWAYLTAAGATLHSMLQHEDNRDRLRVTANRRPHFYQNRDALIATDRWETGTLRELRPAEQHRVEELAGELGLLGSS